MSVPEDFSEKNIAEFEESFSRSVGTKLSLAMDKGRTALFLALKLLNVKKDDEVIIQTYTCKTAIDPLLQLGAKVRLVDIDEDFNLPIDNLKKIVTNRTKVIVATHLFGQPCNIGEISDYCKENNVFLIEDSCQCLGGKYYGKNVGTFGDFSVFSFNVDKPFSLGEGGMLCVNNSDLVDDALSSKTKYSKTSIEVEEELLFSLLIYNILTDPSVYQFDLSINFAKNFVHNNKKIKKIIKNSIENDSSDITGKILNSMNKLDKLTLKIKDLYYLMSNFNKLELIDESRFFMNSYRAKYGLHQLNSYEKLRRIRNENASMYKDGLFESGKYKLPSITKDIDPAYIRYSILNKTNIDTKQIYKDICVNGYEVGNFNWPKTINLRSPYKKIIHFKGEDLQNSMNIVDNIIQLPIHSYVNKSDISEIVNHLINIS